VPPELAPKPAEPKRDGQPMIREWEALRDGERSMTLAGTFADEMAEQNEAIELVNIRTATDEDAAFVRRARSDFIERIRYKG
jgi:hypothetical protein